MTPLAPGGQNGGAGLVATSLVHHLSQVVPDQELLLLTASESHAELSALEAPNVSRLCVRGTDTGQPRWRRLARQAVAVLPASLRSRSKDALWRLRNTRRNAHLMDALGADLLFCPFTVPTFARPEVPTVAIVHDLQHVEYPSFFTAEQRLARERHLQQVCARAARIVCVSDHVRQTLLAHANLADADSVVTIRHGLLREVTASGAPADRLPLPPNTYLLYPANFWPHKNHARLFEALARLRAERPQLDLRLVCTGAPNAFQAQLRRLAVETLGPEVVLFPGYVAAEALDALLRNCTALVYPSLYEGFGMPVLEAMAAARPVLCSTATSLPEVAGEAAVYFDPLDPDAMLRALVWLVDRPEDFQHRVAYGRARAARFGDARTMACAYQRVFDQVLAAAA